MRKIDSGSIVHLKEKSQDKDYRFRVMSELSLGGFGGSSFQTYILDLDQEDLEYLKNKYIPKEIDYKYAKITELTNELAKINAEVNKLKG